MAKGQHLSRHQQGIVKRYYEHRDTLSLQKLGEMVSDLYLAEPRKAEKLWASVPGTLAKAGADPARAKRVVDGKNVAELAALVNELSGGSSRPTPRKGT